MNKSGRLGPRDRDPLRLDVTLAAGRVFRVVSVLATEIHCGVLNEAIRALSALSSRSSRRSCVPPDLPSCPARPPPGRLGPRDRDPLRQQATLPNCKQPWRRLGPRDRDPLRLFSARLMKYSPCASSRSSRPRSIAARRTACRWLGTVSSSRSSRPRSIAACKPGRVRPLATSRLGRRAGDPLRPISLACTIGSSPVVSVLATEIHCGAIS